MPILNYTTKVDVFTTIAAIQSQLVKHGARKILQEYDEECRVIAVSFVIDTPVGFKAIRLPSNVPAVQAVLQRQKVKADYAQAERVAWRIVKDWVEAQMAILEAEMVTMDEIFLPYMLDDSGTKTLYEAYREKQLFIGDGGTTHG